VTLRGWRSGAGRRRASVARRGVVDEVVDPRRALDTERVMVAGDTERMFARDVDTHRGIDDTRTRAQWPSPPNAR